MRLFPLPLALLSFLSLPAQSPQYPAEPVVVDTMVSLYRMNPDGTGIHEKTVTAEIQAESALKEIAVLSIPFASNSEHAEWVYARLRHKDGSITETPVANAMEQASAVTRSAPFYSDLKELQLPLRDLRVGDHLEWQFRITRTKAEAPNHFWGQEAFTTGGILLSETLILDTPKQSAVTVWSPKYKPTETTEGDRHIYRWTNSSLKRTVGPEAAAFKEAEKKRIRTPDEELSDREGRLPDVAWTTFKSWADVGAWYRSLEGDRMLPDADIKAKVAQLTAGKTTQLEKVQAVYTYVATQIHYVGVAFGVGRYQPHSAADVLQNQYGDCKDKHTLLASMLEALGLHPDAVLIGAGIRFNPDLPSPSAFNHLITHLTLEGKPLWLDTTQEVAPFNMLVYLTRDESALIIPPTGAAHVEKTPANPPFPSVDTMDAKGALDSEGVSNSHITLTFRGDNEIAIRQVLRQLSPAQYDQLAQQLCANIGYAGTASNMQIEHIDDTTQPIQLSFDYKRIKAGDWPNLKIIPQLAPVTLPRFDENEPPVEATNLGPAHLETSHAEMKLPEGWTAELPEAVHTKSEWATYDQTYRFEKGVVITDRRVEILKDRIPQPDWKAYSKFLEKVDPGNDLYIQLARAPGTTASKGSVLPRNEDAANFIHDASKLVISGDFTGATRLLDQAKALNPEQSLLWTSYGMIAEKKGEFTRAIQDFQKEIELHPGLASNYAQLAGAQIVGEQHKDAIVSLKRWVELAPENNRPRELLASLQLDEGDALAAAQTAAAAVANTPAGAQPDDRLTILLGRSQLKAGMKDQGHETLMALLKRTDNPDMMNDAAYELADAGLELTLAEDITKKALAQMEEQTRTWTLDENPQTLRTHTQLIQATWDTVGWIAFREGKLDVAESYIRASWLGRQSAEVGMHLGDIELAEGHKEQAIKTYTLALATFPPTELMGVRREPTLLQKQITAKLAALTKAKATPVQDRAALFKLHSWPLGPGPNGIAEYKFLLGTQGVIRVEPAGEKQLPGGLEKIKQAKLTSLLPSDSKAQLVFHAMLNCHSGTCELALM